MFKKTILLLSLISFLFIAGCAKNDHDVLKVGVIKESEQEFLSQIDKKPPPNYTGQILPNLFKDDPQPTIVAFVQQLAKEENLAIEIVEFKSYLEINIALKEQLIDINCFQNQIYLDKTNKELKADFVAVGKTFLAPMGIYSEKLKSIDDLPPNTTIAIPDDMLNMSRALILLEKNRLITLEKPEFSKFYTITNIKDNPLNLLIIPKDSSQIREALFGADLVLLNQNYALSVSKTPDVALVLEDTSSLFTQLIVTRKELAQNEQVQKFVKLYNSAKTKQFIQEKYNNVLVPAW